MLRTSETFDPERKLRGRRNGRIQASKPGDESVASLHSMHVTKTARRHPRPSGQGAKRQKCLKPVGPDGFAAACPRAPSVNPFETGARFTISRACGAVGAVCRTGKRPDSLPVSIPMRARQTPGIPIPPSNRRNTSAVRIHDRVPEPRRTAAAAASEDPDAAVRARHAIADGARPVCRCGRAARLHPFGACRRLRRR